MVTVRHILNAKGSGVVTIGPHTTVFEALEVMAEKDIGALVVTEQDEVVGMFSERDYARKVILKGKSSRLTLVGELMSKTVFGVSPDEPIEKCMALMTAIRSRHLPVIENGRLSGVVSIGDVVNSIITGQEIAIRDLENYIAGCYTTSLKAV